MPVSLTPPFRREPPAARARVRTGLSWPAAAFVGAAAAGWSTPSAAQAINLDFPSAFSGYDQQLGVTVLSRPRSLYETPGIRVGGFEIRPNLDQSIAYNSNPTGTSSSGSFVSRTSAAVSVGSLWPRDSLGASVGVDHYHYFSLSADYTDWNVGLRGGYSIYDSPLTFAYAHNTYHQLGATIGTVRSDTPVEDETDTARIYYTFKFHRLDITPDFSASAYRYGTAMVRGVSLNQQYLDRNVLAGGLTTRYALNDVGGLLVVARAVDSHYVNGTQGQPSNDSQGFMLLGGIDYQAKGAWRYRLLAGMQVRVFTAAQYATRAAPILEGTVIWTPTGLTTVTAVLSRSINDPQAGGTNGYILSQASLRGDHEFMRNVILQARGGVQYAQYLQGGAQTSFNVGAGVNWLFNRNARISFDYDYTKQSAATGAVAANNANNPNLVNTNQYSQSLVGLTLHLGL